MNGVIIFILKLCLFVSAAITAVVYMKVPLFALQYNVQIASVQIVCGCLVMAIFNICEHILFVMRERRRYDIVVDIPDSDEDPEVQLGEEKLDVDPEVSTSSEALPESPHGVNFASTSALMNHVNLIHFTGLLMWTTILTMDYTQPAMCYSFTMGLVSAWLFRTIFFYRKPKQKPTMSQCMNFFIYLTCVSILACVSLSGGTTTEHIVSICSGVTWPFFFVKDSTANCRRPYMIIHTMRASVLTCLLLCCTPLFAWPIHFNQTPEMLVVMFMVQPVVKLMCLLILCLSIQTGHETDLVIVMTVASASQYALQPGTDPSVLIAFALSVASIISVHIFGLCYHSKNL